MQLSVCSDATVRSSPVELSARFGARQDAGSHAVFRLNPPSTDAAVTGRSESHDRGLSCHPSRRWRDRSRRSAGSENRARRAIQIWVTEGVD